MLHAGIANCSMWDPQFDHFSRAHRVIRYDMRGFGRTRAPAMDYSGRDDLDRLLDHLGVERVILLGCSMGGALALDYTLEHPERVAALVLIGPGVSGFESALADVTGEEAQEAAYKAGDYERLIELELQMWVDGPGRGPDESDPAVRAQVRAMEVENLTVNTDGYSSRRLDPPAVGRLHEINVPTLVIVGDGDQPDIVEAAHMLAREIKGAQLLELQNVAHVPNMERPAEVNLAIEDFLNGARL
jgi:pimeloyl-ACP methyl ester carboxylesterase